MFPTYEEFIVIKEKKDKYRATMSARRQSEFADRVKEGIEQALKNGEDHITMDTWGPEGDDWMNWLRSECLQQGILVTISRSSGIVSFKHTSRLNWFEKFIYGVK